MPISLFLRIASESSDWQAGGALVVEYREFAILALSDNIQVTAAIGLLTVGVGYLRAAEAGLVWLLESIMTPDWVWVALGRRC